MSKGMKIGIIGGITGLVIIIIAVAVILMNIFGGTIISAAEAKDIALSHAKVDAAKAEMMNAYLEQDDWEKIYEIQFFADGVNYQYDINAKTGRIEDFDVEGRKNNTTISEQSVPEEVSQPQESDAPKDTNSTDIQSSQNDEQGNTLKSKFPQASLVEADAKKLALERVPGATESDIWMKIDFEDGRLVYEGTIIYDKIEYEFEMDANDGTFYSWEMESVYD